MFFNLYNFPLHIELVRICLRNARDVQEVVLIESLTRNQSCKTLQGRGRPCNTSGGLGWCTVRWGHVISHGDTSRML